MIRNAIPYEQIENLYVPCKLKINPNVKWINNQQLLGSSKEDLEYVDMVYPDEIDYQYEIWKEHNQNPYGTCYEHSAVHWAEWFYWKHTGNTITLTRSEIMDICADMEQFYLINSSNFKQAYNIRQNYAQKNKINDLIGGGWDDVPAITKFNDNLEAHYFSGKKYSEACNKFKILFDLKKEKLGNQIGYFLQGKNVDPDGFMKNMVPKFKKALFLNGPCFFSFQNDDGDMSSGHEVLAIGYDKDNIYYRNSWGSAAPVQRSWSYFSQNGNFWNLKWYQNQLGQFE